MSCYELAAKEIKNYINTADGGYNPAKGNPLRLNKSLTSLPNCVAIYGWFNEPGGQGMKYLKAPWYPYTVIAAAKREGLEVTTDPTEGGIMVWTGGKTGEGHVAGVGRVNPDGTILTVESEYYGRDWATFTRKKGDGNWRDGCYWMSASYVYQGCIRNPFVTQKEEPEVTYEQFCAYLERWLKDTANKPADAWADNAVAAAKDAGIMTGFPDGFHAQSPVRREELAQVAMNILNKK